MKIIPPIAVTDGGYTGPGGPVYDKNGVIQQVPANTLRLTYDPLDLGACPRVIWGTDDVAATTGTLCYSSLIENNTDDGPVWAAATSYSKTNRVRRPNHKVYENVIPGIDSATPESYANFPAATKRWFELRPTNRYAPFDLTYDTQGGAPEVFCIVLRPGETIDTVAFYNLDARAVRVQFATPAGLTGYDKVFETKTSASTSWSTYLFGLKEMRTELTVIDLPLYRQGVIILTFWKPGSTPKVGDIVFGRVQEIGEMEWAPSIRGVDFSDITTNDYAVTRFTKGRNTVVLDCDVFVLNDRFDAVNRILSANGGRPIGVLGDERFDSLQFLGFIIERSGTLESPGGSWFNLQIQRLVETDD